MFTTFCDQSFKPGRILKNLYCVFAVTLFLLDSQIILSQESPVSVNSYTSGTDSFQVTYQNPRVYNLEISFELIPDPAKINRDQDLKVWIPVPREWDSQKNVQILSVQPEPHSQFTDPEFGNKIFYWDFGKYPIKPSYRVDIQVRLLSYDVHAMIDPSNIKPYDKTSKEYELYTRSEHTIHITPKVKELAKAAIGNETNPYLQAQKIFTFVHKKIRYYEDINRSLDYRSLDYMFSNSKIDEKSGEEYFTGDCSHYSALFVALCRSEGIPARCVYGRIGWDPSLNEGNSRTYSEQDTALSRDGFAGAQHHGLPPHMWAEFYLPDYSWIPVDAQVGRFGQLLWNYQVIMSKGRDIFLGPDAPQKHHNGYGYQWVPICDGRVDGILSAVYDIGVIAKARSNVYHTLDPFPADALADYKQMLASTDTRETQVKWRNDILNEIDYITGDIPNRDIEFSKITNKPDWIHSLQYKHDAFVCHMLHKIMGDHKFSQLMSEYEKLLTNSSAPIETDRFIHMAGNIQGENLEWFFSQWEKANGLPHLKLDDVTLEKRNNAWRIKGKLLQIGRSVFKLQVELLLDTEKGQELFSTWLDDRTTIFEYQTPNKPLKLRVDANNDILKFEKMPLQFSRIWNSFPNINIILIYGTVSESYANKTAAERFNNEYLGSSNIVLKPDTSITDNDLNTECVILFGRPETNKITRRFENVFPIKFNRDSFSYNGINYNKTSQGLAQIIEHPLRSKGQFILYAGLSATGMVQFGYLYPYDAAHSFVIYDGDKQINSGDWETDADLLWKFEK
jgi:transglutaminase-like putative cysteine protease